MNKRKVKEFKKTQQHLAKEIAKALEIEKFSVDYEQIAIRAKNGKMRLSNSVVYPNDVIREGKKSRVIVIMHFFTEKCDNKIIGKILKRQFAIEKVYDGVVIRSSFNPNSIEKY